MKRNWKTSLGGIVAATGTIMAVDVPLKWDAPVPDIADGSTIFVVNRQTGTTNTFDVPKGATSAVVQIDVQTMNDIWVCGWCEVINPDGTKPRQYSEKSNVLDVKAAGRSGNLVVK